MAILRGDPIPATDHSTSPPVVRPDSSVRRSARIVGVLFLAGFLAYGVGSLIATDIVRSGDRSGSTVLFVTGAALDAAQLGIRDRYRCPDVPDPATPQQGHSCGLPGHADLRGRRSGHRCREPHRPHRLPRHRREFRLLQRRRGRARLSEASSSALCSSAPGSFRAGWLSGVSSATRASPGAVCWSCSASRAPGSSAPCPVDCSS